MDWRAILSRWDAGWHGLREQAIAAWSTDIAARPAAYQGLVEQALAELHGAQAALVRWAVALGQLGYPEAGKAAWEAARARYEDLAAGIMAEAQPTTGGSVEVGIAPVVLVVAGLGLTVAAIAWAVAARPYAQSLRTHAETAARELEARIALSREGRTLQQSTLPPGGGGGGRNEPLSPGDLAWLLGIGVLAIGALSFVGSREARWAY